MVSNAWARLKAGEVLEEFEGTRHPLHQDDHYLLMCLITAKIMEVCDEQRTREAAPFDRA